MSPITSVISAVAVSAAPSPADTSGTNGPGSGQASDFSTTLASASASANGTPTRRTAVAHGKDDAQGGASVPSDGNAMPPSGAQALPPVVAPPVAPIPVPVAPAALSADITAASARPVGALAAAAATAARGPALPAGGRAGAGSAAAAAAAVNTTGAGRDANQAQDPLNAATLAGDAAAAATTGADAAPAAASFADVAAAVAAVANGRPAATPGPTGSARALPSAAPAGAGGTDAAADSQGAQAAAAAATPVPVPAAQNPGSSERHAHDGPGNQAAEPAPNAAASVTAGEAGVHGLTAAQATQSAPSAAPPEPQVHSPQFPDQLAAHVSYLVDQNLNGATLQVSPPQLGPIELRVSIDAGHAQVWLSAHSAAACDALQQSSARLRDMLATQGFGQVSVDVSQRSFQDRSGSAPAYVWGGATGSEAAPAVAAAAARPLAARQALNGMLDAYA